ncbi:hypothetical protein ACOSQ4_017003 [Xanthoceras sorbifolium]
MKIRRANSMKSISNYQNPGRLSRLPRPPQSKIFTDLFSQRQQEPEPEPAS